MIFFFFFSTTSHHHHGKKLVSLQQQRQPKNDILEQWGCQRRCILLTINEQFLDSLITISLKRSNLLSVSPSPPCSHPKGCRYLSISRRQTAFPYRVQMDCTRSQFSVNNYLLRTVEKPYVAQWARKQQPAETANKKRQPNSPKAPKGRNRNGSVNCISLTSVRRKKKKKKKKQRKKEKKKKESFINTQEKMKRGEKNRCCPEKSDKILPHYLTKQH